MEHSKGTYLLVPLTVSPCREFSLLVFFFNSPHDFDGRSGMQCHLFEVDTRGECCINIGAEKGSGEFRH